MSLVLLIVLILSILFVAIVGAFAGNMQATTLYVGKKIAPIGSEQLAPRGFQDSITPRIQDSINILLQISYLLILILGTIRIWYLGVCALVTSFVLQAIFKAFYPHKLLFYVKIIFWDLTNREADYAKSNDKLRAEAAHSMANDVAKYMEYLISENLDVPEMMEAKSTSFGYEELDIDNAIKEMINAKKD